MSNDILIGDPASIARETERLAATVAHNLRQYARLKRAARNFGDRIARETSPATYTLRQAWRAVDEVLREIPKGGTTSEEVEAGW